MFSINYFGLFFISVSLCLLLRVPPEQDQSPPNITIDVWYGDHQEFGTPGITQQWINILGNISAEDLPDSTYYRLNQNEVVGFSLGSDLHRLAAQGDFNIDLPVALCKHGLNHLTIGVWETSGTPVEKQITFNLDKSNQWPLPYEIKWSEVEELQKVVQVIDGKWEITEHGVRNVDTYYDRVLGLGDNSWKNYEVTTTVIFHDFTPPVKGPPTYNVSHAAIASHWPGHDVDKLQPHRKWFPLGATSEFRLTTNLDSCRWRIFDGPKPGYEKFHVEQATEDYRSIQLGSTYGMKHRVESLDGNRTRYSVKLWPFNQPEPESWDFSGIESDVNVGQGSALLIAHNTSVTFGDVMVVPIE